jgi:hypothetical protein
MRNPMGSVEHCVRTETGSSDDGVISLYARKTESAEFAVIMAKPRIRCPELLISYPRGG